METILAVKQMDEEYDFVHCLMGNHELMFLAAMEYGITEEKVSDSAENWLEANHGRVTWEAFLDLPEEEQNGLYEWLKNLPFSCDILLDGRLIMAAHAFPYFYDMEYTQTERQRRKMDAVWRRLLLRENPFEGYQGKKNYSLLVCGHTITDFYYQQMNREAGGNILSSLPGNRNRIYRAERFVDIDCGGKCLSWYGENSHVMHAAERAQLAAYCLETDEEFYVGRPRGPVGELMLGESVPGWTPPEIEVQEKEPPPSARRNPSPHRPPAPRAHRRCSRSTCTAPHRLPHPFHTEYRPQNLRSRASPPHPQSRLHAEDPHRRTQNHVPPFHPSRSRKLCSCGSPTEETEADLL